MSAMNAPWALSLLLVVTLVAQAVMPGHRLLVVLGGAALSCAGSAWHGIASVERLFAGVPWNVLLILVALQLFADRLSASGVFGLASLRITQAVQARPVALAMLFALGTYVVSGLVNNLTALLVVLPVLITVFTLVGVTQRFAVWTLGTMLVACNLGGAATPIGDFPAVLLLGRGAMAFDDYLLAAAPPTMVAMALLLLAWLVVRPARDMHGTPLGARLTLATLAALYRGVRLHWPLLGPCLLAMAAMLAAWMAAPPAWGLTPELVAWLGVGLVLLVHPRDGEAALRRGIDLEAALFLLALFLMVGAVRETGLFTQAARALTEVPLPPVGQVVLFLVVAALLTGLFSAGPSMAALLEVAEVLARDHPPAAIYVGLALAVCAGSSLFLTAATAGPLAQSLVERAQLDDTQGRAIRFGFREFLPVGLLGFGVILLVAIVRTVWLIG